jgi:RNA polymerase sigma factor (sigma-70 family)
VAGEDENQGLDLEAAYRQHAAAVYRFCLLQTGNAAVAEDLAADTFAAAQRALPRMGQVDNVPAWLFTIARNMVRNHRTRAGRFRNAFAKLTRLEGDRTRDVESEAGIREELRRAAEAVSGLRERDRLLVGLRTTSGLSYAEIAAMTGLTEHAATVATLRALKRVRDAVERRSD